jgi:hypothetical protein
MAVTEGKGEEKKDQKIKEADRVERALLPLHDGDGHGQRRILISDEKSSPSIPQQCQCLLHIFLYIKYPPFTWAHCFSERI